MSSNLQVRPLATEQILQAYTLVSLFDPELGLDQWTAYASQLLGTNEDRAQGILTVQTRDSYIYGLCAHWLRPDLRRGSVLEIDNFAVIAMARGGTIANLLLRSLEKTGRESGCSCISVKLIDPKMRRWLRASDRPKEDFFSAAGFRGDQLRLRKCFHPASQGLREVSLS